MTLIRYIYPPVAAIIMTSLLGCEKDLNLDKYRNPEIEKMLVVNSILNPDSIIKVSVTNPYFFSETHLAFNPVESLDVKITSDEYIWEALTYDAESKLYLSKRKPCAGEMLRLEIAGREGRVSSCDTVPHKVEIEKVEATVEGPIHIFWDKDYRFTYNITFRDTPGENNYYFLAIEDDSLPYEFSEMGQVDYTIDYVFQVLASMINNDIQGWQPEGIFGYPFSDKGIDGKEYTLTVAEVLQIPWIEMIEKLPRKIKLYSISKSYFEYMVSVLSMDYEDVALKGNLLSLGLMEPDKIFSNIKGGAGLMGCYNLSSHRIDLLQLVGGWPSK